MSIEETLLKVLQLVREEVHPSDLVDLVEGLNDEQKQKLFALLSDKEAALIIQEMEEFDRVALLKLLTKERASAILREMATDDAADLIGEMPPEDARELLNLIGEESEEIKGLLKYREDTAGGIMTTEFISLPADMTAEEAIHRLREIAPAAEIIYYVYVVDDKTRLIGVISLRDLIAAEDGTLLKEVMYPNVISVPADMDQEEVARVVARYDLLAIPVVDDQQRLLGIITVDDILDVVEEEATEDIYRLVGTSEVQGVDLVEASVIKVAQNRLPWLIISLLGGLLSGSIIGIFEHTLQSVVLLAVFIPVIMDMGGNVGTQSSTVFVRGIATGEIEPHEIWRYLFKEIRVGITMGLVCGLLIALAAFIWQGIPILGIVVGLSMFITVTFAALIGTLIPLVFNRMGMDPALTAGPFVTTIKDVTGLLIYFWIANLFMERLI